MHDIGSELALIGCNLLLSEPQWNNCDTVEVTLSGRSFVSMELFNILLMKILTLRQHLLIIVNCQILMLNNNYRVTEAGTEYQLQIEEVYQNQVISSDQTNLNTSLNNNYPN